MTVLTADYRRELEIHRYPIAVHALVPLVALVLQAWLPRLMGRFAWFDLPLLVTVYFSLSRRNAIHGTLLGAVLGLFQDGLSLGAIGIWGIANSLCGYLAASVGIRLVVENHTIRTVLTFCFTLLAGATAFFVTRVVLGLNFEWNWLSQGMTAAGNAALSLVLFPLLDRTQVRD